MLTVYIGFDEREPEAWDVCANTLLKYASRPVNIQPLDLDKLEAQGLMTRKWSKTDGQMYDEVSQAPMATKFAISRFLVPLIHQSGWAIFMDCDMIFQDDIYRIEEHLDYDYPVMCVHHDHHPTETIKMDNQIQTVYPKKNWSSVMAFNCDHPLNQNLSLLNLNNEPGRNLHGFCWLDEDQIGELPREFNWLVNVQEKPENPVIWHYTLGGPWFPDWEPQPYDDEWLQEYSELLDGNFHC